jgi:hypothetical protein
MPGSTDRRQGIAEAVAVTSPAATIAESILEIWLEDVMLMPHSFANFLKAQDRTKIARPLRASLELFRDQTMNSQPCLCP